MTRIYWGDDAKQAFGHLLLRDPAVMRAENEHAFQRIGEIIREHGILYRCLQGQISKAYQEAPAEEEGD